MYRGHVLYRKGTVMEIPDEPKIERVVNTVTGERKLLPATFSVKAMEIVDPEDDEPVTVKKPKAKRAKKAPEAPATSAVTDGEDGEL